MRLGPIVNATLIVRDLERSLAACGELGCVLVARERLPQQRALDMGDASLADAACARLSVGDDLPQLTLIEAAHAEAGAPYARRGWMGLEVAVDADRMSRLSRYTLLGELGTDAAGLRSCVVAGPDGEVWKLRERRSEEGARGGLRAALLACADRGGALGFYEGLGLCGRTRHDSALPAFNRHTGLAEGQRHPQAVAELRGAQRIDIVQLPHLPPADSRLRTGLRLLSFARSDAVGRLLQAADDPSARILAGPEGEGIELV